MTTKNKTSLSKKLVFTAALLIGVGIISITHAEDDFRVKTGPKLVTVRPSGLKSKLDQLEERSRQLYESAKKTQEIAQKEAKEADEDLKAASAIPDRVFNLPKGTTEKVARILIGEKPMDLEVVKTIAKKTSQVLPLPSQIQQEIEKEITKTSFLDKLKRFFICH